MNKYEGHTPGPWNMSLDEDIDDDVRQHITIFSPTGDVAEAQGYDYETPEVRANAVLIADAPALAERTRRALKKLRYMRESTSSNLQSAEIYGVIKILEGEA